MSSPKTKLGSGWLRRRLAPLVALTISGLAISGLLGGCATTGAAGAAGEAAKDAEIQALWESIRADMMRGRDDLIDARARRLASLQEERCDQIREQVSLHSRAEHAGAPTADSEVGPGEDAAPVETSTLARCEEKLDRYRTIARISDYPAAPR